MSSSKARDHDAWKNDPSPVASVSSGERGYKTASEVFAPKGREVPIY